MNPKSRSQQRRQQQPEPPKPASPAFNFEAELIYQLRRIVYRLDGIRLDIRAAAPGSPEDAEKLRQLADQIDAQKAALTTAVADNTPT